MLGASKVAAVCAGLWVVMTGAAAAQTFGAPAPSDSQFTFNTFADIALVASALLAIAGLYLREAGLAGLADLDVAERTLLALGIAFVAHWAIGYNLAYTDVSGFMGHPAPWNGSGAQSIDATRPSSAEWLRTGAFSMLSVLIAASAFGARLRRIALVLFVIVFAAAIQPIATAWAWGGGWLAARGFLDLAGGAVTHIAGGAAALAGLIVLGGDKSAYSDEDVDPAASLLGIFFLWIGFSGVVSIARIEFDSMDAATLFADRFASAQLAAAGGVIAAALMARAIPAVGEMRAAFIGAVAAFAAISIGPDAPLPHTSLLFGATAGAVAVLFAALLSALKIADETGGASAHLAGGLWGALAASAIDPRLSFVDQTVGAFAIGGFVFAASLALWLLIKFTVRLRRPGRRAPPADSAAASAEPDR